MKRKVIYTVTALLVIVVAIIAACNIIVNNNAKGLVSSIIQRKYLR